MLEPGFAKGNSSNLPRVDVLMLGEFLGSNSNFISAELRNVKSSASSRPTYGDDAVGFVQVKREGDLCMLKGKICPEHKVHAKLYGVTLKVDEKQDRVTSIECHNCVASLGLCIHAIAFLLWVHRRSEEPFCTSIKSYWNKSKHLRVGSIKYITAKQLSNGSPILPSDNRVLNKFLAEAKKRKLTNCELLKHCCRGQKSL